MMASFSDQVRKSAAAQKAFATAVFRKSAERTAEKANTSRFKGGLTPIDTSFLINSFGAAVNGTPQGQSVKPDSMTSLSPSQKSSFAPDLAAVTVVINSAKLGDIISFGWAAEYAERMNDRYGFRNAALAAWNNTVTATAKEYGARLNVN